MTTPVSLELSQLDWRTSSFSQGQNGCVEMAWPTAEAIMVRDSKLGETSPALRLPTAHWLLLLQTISSNR